MLWQQSLLERPRTGPAQKNRSIERFFCGLLKQNLCRFALNQPER
ncbi:hypothetical protein STM14_3109 [Salmonella enterica subsp. enterica serovar Typhimurium str. 14028S]|uniref:Uncharacterized protein n=2 Tax=Salmonella enterica I TaxID=59201 RepID=A0A0F6B4U9_SALT1|nr:hypothetical protein SPAB_00401 [Salmonella enterica subsp. enterica serovar Paratyphi B str. SPB7]ACY89540.1 hypothetical protein STM14_3109 [Salmonella enterica subsp. enterica serovar Typhimurium str. 14028S]